MQGIYFEDKNKMLEAWEQLEKIVLFLHDNGTEYYTYINGNYIVIELYTKYDEVVLNWIEENKYKLADMPNNDIEEL